MRPHNSCVASPPAAESPSPAPPLKNGLGDLWAILDFCNPGLVGSRPEFIAGLSGEAEAALRALNGLLVFRRTKSEPEVAKELPDRIDELDHCAMTKEQIGLYQAVLDSLVADSSEVGATQRRVRCWRRSPRSSRSATTRPPTNTTTCPRWSVGQAGPAGRDHRHGVRLRRRVLIFTHFASWGGGWPSTSPRRPG